MPSFPKRQLNAADILTQSVFTANGQIEAFDVTEFNTIAIQIAVAGTLTYVPEVSLDGTVWVPAMGFLVSSGSQATTLANAALGSIYRYNVAGVRRFRLRCSAFTSTGTVSVFRAALPAEGVDAATALPVGTNLIGDVGIGVRATAGGLSTLGRLASSAATTNATLVRNSACRLYKIRGFNASAATKFMKLYNKATAPTVGTDTPVATLGLKAGEPFDIDFVPTGLSFATGLGYALTGAAADNDTTALAAGDIVGLNVWYV